MSNIQTTNDIKLKSEESTEPQMTAETYRFVMGWSYYPEPATGERQVKLGVHTRTPDFSVLNFQGGVRCFPAYGQTMFEQREPRPGAGFCEGNEYGKKSKPKIGEAISLRLWQTETSKVAWNEHVERLRKKEAASVRKTVSPEVPHVCVMCRDTNPLKKGCKLLEQSMGSLCSLYERHRGLIILPANKRQRPYAGSLRQNLDKFERRNRPAKIWRVSTLPTFNRNDGEFVRMGTDEMGNPIRIYRDSNPRLVPEVAFSHDRTEDSSGYDECAFPDDWQMDLAETNGKDYYTFVDAPDSDIKKQCFEMPKPNWVSVTRKYYDNRRRLFVGFQTYYAQDKRTELNRVWHWNPETRKFTFTVEERMTVVPVRHDMVVTRAEEYPTLINVQTEEQFEKELKAMSKATGDSIAELRAESTILVQSSTVVTKSERKYYNWKRETEKQKRIMTGYLILKDVKDGMAMPKKHGWPVRSKRAAAPMIQVPAGR